MHGIELTRTPPAEVVYPDSDGQPMAETGIHVLAILYLIGALKQFFLARDDVYVTGDMFVHLEGKPKSRAALIGRNGRAVETRTAPSKRRLVSAARRARVFPVRPAA